MKTSDELALNYFPDENNFAVQQLKKIMAIPQTLASHMGTYSKSCTMFILRLACAKLSFMHLKGLVKFYTTFQVDYCLQAIAGLDSQIC